MEINDALKFRSYGWKQDTTAKQDHIQRITGRNQQWYPSNSHGIVNEWKAVIDHQAEVEQTKQLQQQEMAKQ